MRRLATLSVQVAFALAVGVASGRWAEHEFAPAPTPENASPPPEAFYAAGGALVGFAVALVVALLAPGFVSGWRAREQ